MKSFLLRCLLVWVWWARNAGPIAAWVHPEAFGGLPGKEPYAAAYVNQANLEKAIVDGTQHAAALSGSRTTWSSSRTGRARGHA